MLELNADNATDYLRSQRWVGEGPVRVETLAGGVSNQVLCVTQGSHCFVVKQSRPQLRTRDAWYADLERVYREQEVMQALAGLLPGTVPEVLFVDRANFVYAMSHAPLPFRVWKESLLDGDAEERIGVQVGRVLGKMHEGTARRPEVFASFADPHVFEQLRIEPFYRRLRQRRPEVATPLARLIDEMLTRRESLCHGDYTPKNMLVHAGGFMLVDYETAYYGDPAMDLGLLLCHVMLKAVRRPQWRERYFAVARAIWQSYAAEVSFRSPADLQRRGVAHFGACVLARIDGASPVDYLPEESQREMVRMMGRTILGDGVGTWAEVLAMWDKGLG